jgi:hypothetical protein
MFVFLHFFAQSLTLDDFTFGILASAACFDSRIPPMCRSWYRLVPTLHIFTDPLPYNVSSVINCSNQSNVIFHVSTVRAFQLLGTEFDLGWNHAQTRHFAAMADLYDTYPNSSFYFFGDDDTYVLPENLLSVASSLDPDSIHLFGILYGVTFHSYLLFNFSSEGRVPEFAHGGSGVLISRGLMRILGPRLRDCAVMTEMANVGSDMRLAACLRRIEGLDGQTTMMQIARFHSGHPWDELMTPTERAPATFHQVTTSYAVDRILLASITEWGDGFYLDWSEFAFRQFMMLTEAGTPMYFLFGFQICRAMVIGECIEAQTGIVTSDNPDFDYRQDFGEDIVIYYKCIESMKREEVVHIGRPPLPKWGAVFGLRCPPKRRFGVYSPWNSTERWVHDNPEWI